MADAARRIRHDLAALEKAISALSKEFDQIYDSYLGILRTSIQTQVVLACYHLCTRTYPDRFLELSYRQRESFQQALQHHIHQTQQKLMHAYVLATVRLCEEEEDVVRPRRQRSLPAAERGSRRDSRDSRDFRGRREFDDIPSDDGGPSVEFIAITGLDGEDAMEAAKDPFLAAALSEFADNLALDEQAILKRVKQELLRKAAKSSKHSERLAASSDANDITETDPNEEHGGEGDGITDTDAPDHNSTTVSEDNPTDDQSSPTRQPSDDDPDQNDPDQNDPDQSAAMHQGSGGGDAEGADEARTSPSIPDQPSMADFDGALENTSADQSGTLKDKLKDKLKDRSETPPLLDNPDGKLFSSCDERLTPDLLSMRQKQLETNLVGLLRDLSQQINHELHQVGMIPKKIPGAVLKAALKADVSGESISGSPNVLNLLVEAEGKSQDSKVMRVTALRLRPPEMEFSDPQLSACRSRIRELTGKLQKLGKDYHKKQQERAIAEAESAWRSSWYDRET